MNGDNYHSCDIKDRTHQMRNLFLLRHAKSSWKDASLSDFDRPLSNRGKQDAPLIARQFLKNKIEIDLIISSSARRTLETGKIFENVLRLTSKILKDDNLYYASSYDMLKTITQINDNIRNVIIVCHNPGITNLANYLSNIV
jgi:phosphohistidine phosphatase